jgi:DNA-binding protein HU-beta
MTKAELVRLVSYRSGLPPEKARRAVDAILATISETLRAGDEVNFTGFGKFSVVERGARQGVNPQTGARIQIGASRVPKFAAGSKLKRLTGLPGDGDEKY